MWINKFLEYLTLERGYSSHTVLAYKKDLEQFSDFLKIDLLAVEPLDVRNYLSELLSIGLEETSINRKLSSLKSFYKFLLEIEVVSKNPTELVRNLKCRRKVIIPISENEMKGLLQEDVFENNFEGCRDKLIIELLYNTGIRRMELINLLWSQVDLENNEISVKGKGFKERRIPINDKIKKLILSYKYTQNEKYKNGGRCVFITGKGKKMYPKLVYNIVNSYLSLVSVKVKKSPHILRHSFATHMLNNGAEINSIKEILGHSSLAATQIYTHSNISELKKILIINHPRGKNK